MRICLRLEMIVMYFFLLKCEISCMLSTVFFTKRICLTRVRRNDDDDIKFRRMCQQLVDGIVD